MATQAQSLFFYIKTNFLCLALVLCQSNVVFSRLNYYVDSLDDTRNAMLSYFSGSSESGASVLSNNIMRTVDEIEKTVYDAQAIRSFYTHSPARLEKIKQIIKVAAKQGSSQFIRQSLGHALYTASEIGKKKTASRPPLHRRKRCVLCVDTMKQFMDLIKNEIGEKNFTKFIGNRNNKATLMFAIDDTGSMGEEIQAAKDIATYIVNSSRPSVEVDYILSPFNDPENGRAIKKAAGKGKEFINEIQALYAHGGGDCPEMTFKGILKALEEVPENNSPLYVFTDAAPKDATQDNVEVARMKANFIGVNVYFFATGGCGDEASVKPFKDLARETCGQFFELPKSRSEVAKMKKVTKDLLGGTTCAEGTGGASSWFFGKKKRSVDFFKYNLLVDDTMERIIVSVSSENTGAFVDLKDPQGASITSGNITVSKVTIFEMDHPTPGIWRLIVSAAAGKHTYVFKGSSETNLDFNFIFVIPRYPGTPMPIPHPLARNLAHVILIVTEADKLQSGSLNLNILSKDRNITLGRTAVRPAGTSGAHFSASFPTPTVPFKLQLIGKTKKNFHFERSSQSTVHPSHVVVKVLYARNEFTVPKSGYEFTMFFVYNTGATEVFDFKVKGTSNFEAQYSTSPVRISKDRVAFFSVRFTATSSAVSGTAENVLVTVTGQTTKVSAVYVVSLMVA